ncbi:MAG: hypothetical protein PHE87_01960 [Victivallaceae bacterium]|nr:hypothetical protein [Victivallaceae bacterium]
MNMSKTKRKEKKKNSKYMTVFINGKQKRVKRPELIDGMDIDTFIQNNADPIWLHQNEMWEYMPAENDMVANGMTANDMAANDIDENDIDEIPF